MKKTKRRTWVPWVLTVAIFWCAGAATALATGMDDALCLAAGMTFAAGVFYLIIRPPAGRRP